MLVGCDLPYYPSPSEIRDFSQGAEALGFATLGFSEHIVASQATDRPPIFNYDDPWHESSTLAAFVAAVTERIVLNPAVMLITLRHPVLVAKQLAELQMLSEGRLRIAASVGWNREEQQALGVEPSTRAARFEESLQLIRRLLTENEVTHHGEHYELVASGIHPRPPTMPAIWLGGGNFATEGAPLDVTIDRAARLADGFKLMAPTGIDADTTLRLAERLHRAADTHGRTLQVEARLLTQVTPADEWPGLIKRYRQSGLITSVGLGNRIVGGSVDDQLELLQDFIDRTGEEWR